MSLLHVLLLATPAATITDPPPSPQRARVRESIEEAVRNDPDKCIVGRARDVDPQVGQEPEGKVVDVENPDELNTGVALDVDDCPSKRKEKAMETPPAKLGR